MTRCEVPRYLTWLDAGFSSVDQEARGCITACGERRRLCNRAAPLVLTRRTTVGLWQCASTDRLMETHQTWPLSAQKLARFVDAASDLGPGSRVLAVGSDSGALILPLQRVGVTDILAVDVSSGMLAELRQRFSDPGSLGNEPRVRPLHVCVAAPWFCVPATHRTCGWRPECDMP